MEAPAPPPPLSRSAACPAAHPQAQAPALLGLLLPPPAAVLCCHHGRAGPHRRRRPDLGVCGPRVARGGLAGHPGGQHDQPPNRLSCHASWHLPLDRRPAGNPHHGGRAGAAGQRARRLVWAWHLLAAALAAAVLAACARPAPACARWPPPQVRAAPIHSFAGGRDAAGLTLAYVDRDSAFCAQASSARGVLPRRRRPQLRRPWAAAGTACRHRTQLRLQRG